MIKILIDCAIGGDDRAEKVGSPVIKSHTLEVVICLP